MLCHRPNDCYNFQRCFSSLRTSFTLRRNKDRRRFIYYSIYAWGVPLLWTATTIWVDQKKLLPDKWSPRMAPNGNMCWFTRKFSVSDANWSTFWFDFPSIPCLSTTLAWTFPILSTAVRHTHFPQFHFVRIHVDSLQSGEGGNSSYAIGNGE